VPLKRNPAIAYNSFVLCEGYVGSGTLLVHPTGGPIPSVFEKVKEAKL
jgi:hypothetical protein